MGLPIICYSSHLGAGTIRTIDRLDPPRLRQNPLALTQKAIDQLTATVRFRRIDEGITLMERIADDLQQLKVSTANPGSLLVLVAQWIDAGFRDARFLTPFWTVLAARSARK